MNKTQTLSPEERKQIALEEWTKQRFDLTSIVSMGQAGELILDTDSDDIKIESELTIRGKQYMVKAVYTMKKI
jgi:hypothetical protein